MIELDLNSPNTKQAMLRLGVSPEELKMPLKGNNIDFKSEMKLYQKSIKSVKAARNYIIALKYVKTYEVSGRKTADVYRQKLGILNKYILDNGDKDDIINKNEIEKEVEIDDNKSITKEDVDHYVHPLDSESFPQIRERSNTIHSKQSISILTNKKQSNFISKQHQAYSLLQLNSLKELKTQRRINQSRMESYQQMPFATVDDIDDQIASKGAKTLIRNYSQKIA